MTKMPLDNVLMATVARCWPSDGSGLIQQNYNRRVK